MPKKSVLVIIFLLISFFGVGQDSYTDSLLNILKKSKEDTNKVNLLNQISREFLNEADYIKTKVYATDAISLAKQLTFKKGEATANKTIGNLFFEQGDYSKAIEFYFNALKIYEEIKYKAGIAFIYTNIGNAYSGQKDNAKAIAFINQSIEGLEVLKMQKSSQYFNALNTMGVIYENLKEYDKAIEVYFKCQIIADEINDLEATGIVYNNIGNMFKEKQNYDKALEYFFKSLKIREEIGDKYYIATTYNNIGSTYLVLKQYKEALNNCSKSLDLAKQVEALDLVVDAEFYLSSIYDHLNNKSEAFWHYKKYISARDSSNDIQNSAAKIKKQAASEFKAREEELNANHKKEQTKKDNELNRQKTIRYAFTIGFVLVLLLVFIVFRNLKQTRNKNQIIESQKKEVENKNHVIQEKQKEIVDSITYAQRIQKALLASDQLLNKNLPEYFVFFKPKDIVSGDFYWATLKENKFYLAVCDSTGHGVPGAFMSLLNISFLNQAINEKQINEPGLILNHVRENLINALKDDGSLDGGSDGMDCVLCSFDFSNGILNYSAANNNFYIVRNNELLLNKADKMPVGKSPNEKIAFSSHQVKLQKNDVIYLLTDGYPDQFGGPKGKKFKYKQLEELLVANNDKRMISQKEILNKKFEEWLGNVEQVDDVLLIGIKVT